MKASTSQQGQPFNTGGVRREQEHRMLTVDEQLGGSLSDHMDPVQRHHPVNGDESGSTQPSGALYLPPSSSAFTHSPGLLQEP